MEECDHPDDVKCHNCQFKEAICKTCGSLLMIIPIEDYEKRIKELNLENVVRKK